jgi:peptidoglycan/xylan/chitin deacetylase (PgdA/CDA1 family)
VGGFFKAALWVYTPAATVLQLGAFKTGATDAAAGVTSYNTQAGWNKLEWGPYEHTDAAITMLGLEQPNQDAVTLASTLYIDDILIEGANVGEPEDNSPPAPTPTPKTTKEAILQEIEENWRSMGYTSKPTKYMALTYDDGPTEKSLDLMDALAAKRVKATFFLIGSRIAGKESVVRAMRDGGYELGNHSYTHPSSGTMNKITQAEMEEEIQQCTDAIYAAANSDGRPVTPKFFRAPNVVHKEPILLACAAKGLPLIAGHSTKDYTGGTNAGSPQSIAAEQINNAKEWQIALSHDPWSGNSSNILAAVPLMVDELRAKGYYLLTLSEMLLMKGGAAVNGQVYQDFADIYTPVTARPAAPPPLTSVSAAENRITVIWQAAEEARKYRYAYSTENTDPAAPGAWTETESLFANIDGLVINTVYYVWVRSGNELGWSDNASCASVTTAAQTFTKLKENTFDNLSVFRVTDNPPYNGAVYNYQLGGDSGPKLALSNEQDHTTGSGQSLKWSGRKYKYQRVKLDSFFTAADLGRTFKITVWVYTDTAAKIQVGAYRISGTTASPEESGAALGPESFSLSTGWNEVLFTYVHGDLTATQLGFEQPESASSVVSTFYFDDITVTASEIGETAIKNIVFDDLEVFAMTKNPPDTNNGNWVINDWQGGGGTAESNAALSAEKDHTTGAGKSLKFFNRTDKSYRIKFDKMFTPADLGSIFNASMWVYTDTATWIQLTVYRVSGLSYTSGKGGSDSIERSLFRVEPGWNELVWRGYVHNEIEGTQLGIEQQGAETAVGTLYIDDLLLTKNTAVLF